jgi:DNA-binding NarL/FixJ family response regulator
VKVLAIIEDDPDLRLLIRITLKSEPEFEIIGEAASAEAAIELLRNQPSGVVGLIILDHSLEGELTGLDAAPTLKTLAPNAKIILFTAYEQLRQRADAEPAIDAFLLKTNVAQLLTLARQVVGLG